MKKYTFVIDLDRCIGCHGCQVACKQENGVALGACRNEGAMPLFFCNPLYFRDARMLATPGVRHTFLLAGMAYGVRRALLDELTITEGPDYEAHAKAWLEAHPGSSRTDVPQLHTGQR